MSDAVREHLRWGEPIAVDLLWHSATGKAQLIEHQVDPVGTNLDFCDHGTEKSAHMLDIEILPAGGKPRSLVQKRFLGNGVGSTTLNCVQHSDRIGEPCAYPASDQSLDMDSRDALTPIRRLIVSRHQ